MNTYCKIIKMDIVRTRFRTLLVSTTYMCYDSGSQPGSEWTLGVYGIILGSIGKI